jgi:integrase
MSKRARGEGTIFQRKDGLWCAAAFLEIDGITKRRVWYGKTQQEALAKLNKVKQLAASGRFLLTKSISLRQLIERWLNDVVRIKDRPTTYATYQTILAKHVLPILGSVSLTKLTPDTIQHLYSLLEKQGRSLIMIRKVHARLRTALGQAVKWRMLIINPSDGVTPPTVARRTMQVLDEAQARRFLEYARRTPYYALYLLAITGGLRQGELFALRWTDIDLRTRNLRIRHTLQDLNGRLELADTKTHRSRRAVLLARRVVDALILHRSEMESRGIESEFCFCDSLGKPLRKSNFIRRWFKPLLREAGLPNIRFHDLRHTAATLLLARGINAKVVQERLGHASVNLTLEVYGHVLPSMQQDAADRLDDLLPGGLSAVA